MSKGLLGAAAAAPAPLPVVATVVVGAGFWTLVVVAPAAGAFQSALD